MKVKCLSLDSSVQSEVDLNEDIFGSVVRLDIIDSVIKWQSLKAKSFHGVSKNRSQIKGSQIKLFRQKGTGNARTGNAKSPHKRGGGVAMGPVARFVCKKLPKKVRKLGLTSALSLKAKEELITCIDGISSMSDIKTSTVRSALLKNISGNTLIISDKSSDVFNKSVANLKNVNVLPPEGLNVYDIIRHKTIIISVECLKKIEDRFNG